MNRITKRLAAVGATMTMVVKAMDIERMIKELHNDIFNTWDSNKIIESIILLKK